MSSPSDRDSDEPRARRASLRVRVIQRVDDIAGADALAMTPEERVAMVWPLTQSVWAVTQQAPPANGRMLRHAVWVRRRD